MLHVHGVAIPTIHGIRNVLDHIRAQMPGKQTHVLWINLREEPVITFSFLQLLRFGSIPIPATFNVVYLIFFIQWAIKIV